MSRVLIAYKNSLLNRILTNLLGSQTDLSVVVGEATDMESLKSEISHHAPGVVLMGESMPLATTESLIKLMNAQPGLRVIVISEDTNWLHIYRKEDVLLTCAEDLYDVIQAA